MRGLTQDGTSYSKIGYEMILQWDNWQNLLDMANAVRYGFSQYRLPKPGEAIDIFEAQARVKNIDYEWSQEHGKRGYVYEKPCPDFSSCSVQSQCYLHSILESDTSPDSPGFDSGMYW